MGQLPIPEIFSVAKRMPHSGYFWLLWEEGYMELGSRNCLILSLEIFFSSMWEFDLTLFQLTDIFFPQMKLKAELLYLE